MGAVRPVKFIISGVDKFSRQFKKANKSLKGLASAVRPVGSALTLGLTLPVAAFGFKTLQVAGNFESTMNAVQVATQATSEELKKLSLDARDIGKTTQFSASQAANAFEQLGFAGVGVGKVVKATGIVMDFAAASGKELGQASVDLLSISNALRKPLSELGELSDALGSGFSASTNTLGQLVEGFREGAPVAKSLGISLAELTAGIAAFGDVGFKGTRGGTKFRNFLSRLVEPVPRAVVELDKLGIARTDLFDNFGKLKSFQNANKSAPAIAKPANAAITGPPIINPTTVNATESAVNNKSIGPINAASIAKAATNFITNGLTPDNLFVILVNTFAIFVPRPKNPPSIPIVKSNSSKAEFNFFIAPSNPFCLAFAISAVIPPFFIPSLTFSKIILNSSLAPINALIAAKDSSPKIIFNCLALILDSLKSLIVF